jgi:hypothetical protein
MSVIRVKGLSLGGRGLSTPRLAVHPKAGIYSTMEEFHHRERRSVDATLEIP